MAKAPLSQILEGYRWTPRVVTWEVTRACPLRCTHCRAEAIRARHPDELDTREGRDLIDQVAEGNGSVIAGSTSDGNGFVFVSHTGQVCPSGFLPVSGGDVRDGDLVDVYRNASIFRELRNPSRLKGKCRVCEYRKLCGGSRARAWAVTGDWLESDPFCPYVPEAYRKRMEAGEAEPVEAYFEARRQTAVPGADGFADAGSPVG